MYVKTKMDTYKTFLVLTLFQVVISCTYNQYVYSCDKDDKFLNNINSNIKNKTIMISLTCTSIHNISALFTNDWGQLKIISIIQNKYLICEKDVTHNLPDVTVYCYNKNFSFCFEDPPWDTPPLMYNDEYLYAVLLFVLLPCLISCCTYVSIKMYDLINKIKKRKGRLYNIRYTCLTIGTKEFLPKLKSINFMLKTVTILFVFGCCCTLI